MVRYLERLSHHFRFTNIHAFYLVKELANDYAELGAVYNGFSLNEEGAVANAIEKIGQAVDSSYTETTQMVRDEYPIHWKQYF